MLLFWYQAKAIHNSHFLDKPLDQEIKQYNRSLSIILCQLKIK